MSVGAPYIARLADALGVSAARARGIVEAIASAPESWRPWDSADDLALVVGKRAGFEAGTLFAALVRARVVVEGECGIDLTARFAQDAAEIVTERDIRRENDRIRQENHRERVTLRDERVTSRDGSVTGRDESVTSMGDDVTSRDTLARARAESSSSAFSSAASAAPAAGPSAARRDRDRLRIAFRDAGIPYPRLVRDDVASYLADGWATVDEVVEACHEAGRHGGRSWSYVWSILSERREERQRSEVRAPPAGGEGLVHLDEYRRQL